VRNERLRECVDIMRALFAGDEVTHDGLVRVDRARLWTLPSVAPPFVGAALTPETAAWCGDWADGLVTVYRPLDELVRVIEAFRTNAGDATPVYVQVHLSFAPTDEEALQIAHDQWRTNVFPSSLMADLNVVDEFDIAAKYVRPDDVRDVVLASSDTGQHVAWLQELVELGVDGIYLHHVGKEQRFFIETFGEKVLPELVP
jgi:G6PDH family F420-dependent oxidoreductase